MCSFLITAISLDDSDDTLGLPVTVANFTADDIDDDDVRTDSDVSVMHEGVETEVRGSSSSVVATSVVYVVWMGTCPYYMTLIVGIVMGGR